MEQVNARRSHSRQLMIPPRIHIEDPPHMFKRSVLFCSAEVRLLMIAKVPIFHILAPVLLLSLLDVLQIGRIQHDHFELSLAFWLTIELPRLFGDIPRIRHLRLICDSTSNNNQRAVYAFWLEFLV